MNQFKEIPAYKFSRKMHVILPHAFKMSPLYLAKWQTM